MRAVKAIGLTFGFTIVANIGSASAGTVTYSTLAAFDAATTGQVTGNFVGIPLGFPLGSCTGTPCFAGFNPLSGYPSLQGVSFSTTNVGGLVNVNSAFFYNPGSNDLPAPYAVNSTYNTSASPLDTLIITLPSPKTAFALDFTTLFTSTTASFVLSNGFSTSFANTATIGNTPDFLGFVSNTAFTTITLTVPSPQSWVVADFTLASWNGVSPVPLPGALPLFISGLVGLGLLGGAGRRRLPPHNPVQRSIQTPGHCRLCEN